MKDKNYISPQQQDAIDEILDTFNFETVHQYMTVVNWQWYMDEQYRVPDIYDLKKMLRSLLKDAYRSMNDTENNSTRLLSCGGFTVIVYPNGYCHAFFSISESCVESEQYECGIIKNAF